MKLLKREEFKYKIFERDDYKCVLCKNIAVDAHHIIERRLFEDGGYYMDNGVSLCSECHVLAEQTIVSCESLREKANISVIILPKHFNKNYVYDKWGNIILKNEKRLKGGLFNSEQVQKIIPMNILNKFILTDHVKYPRTPHLSWSENLGKNDLVLNSLNQFFGKEIVVSCKLDGENTTMYNDHIHARSLDSANHPSRDWIKGLWSEISYQIPNGWRICGENMYAKHTIHYKNLKTYFYVFSIWDGKNCLSWNDTIEWCELFNLTPVPILYKGKFDYDHIRNIHKNEYNGDPCEGYVVRLADEFKFDDFSESIGKFVSSQFKINDAHWMHEKMIKNELKIY